MAPTFTDDGVEGLHLHEEVVPEEDEAQDGEEIDEDDGQHRRQQDGATVTRHRLDHVQQSLLAVDNVKELKRKSSQKLNILSFCRYNKKDAKINEYSFLDEYSFFNVNINE